ASLSQPTSGVDRSCSVWKTAGALLWIASRCCAAFTSAGPRCAARSGLVAKSAWLSAGRSICKTDFGTDLNYSLVLTELLFGKSRRQLGYRRGGVGGGLQVLPHEIQRALESPLGTRGHTVGWNPQAETTHVRILPG